MESVDVFKEVNDLSAAGMSEFALRRFDGGTLTIVGSFDLCYYHDVELKFTAVEWIQCPTYFRDPTFRVVDSRQHGPGYDGRRYAIQCDDQCYEIVAAGVVIKVAKVIYNKQVK